MQWKSCSKTMLVFAILALVPALAPPARAGGSDGKVTVSVLYNFGESQTDPQYPRGVIVEGRDGDLYSTTPYGGTSSDGTVYRITPRGELSVLYDLNSYNGSSGLTLGTDGDFYGATVYGGNGPGYGTAFKITPGGDLTTLYDFSGENYDAYPDAPPIEATDSDFYGTTLGDFNGNGGTVYKMTPAGEETTLFKFDRADGASPTDPLIQAADGNFYGTTSSGGNSDNCAQYGCGTIFKLTPKGRLTVLHNFEVSDGFYPSVPLIQGSDGDFYGTVQEGGANNLGVVFKVTPRGKFTLLHIFRGGSDGDSPDAALLQATDGNFYGIGGAGGQYNAGVIYKITARGTYSVIYSFNGTDGLAPESALVQHTNGKLYGVTLEGGSYNYGTFFSVDLGLGPFVSLMSTSGKVGKLVEILGQGFTGAAGVSFNGESAKFKVVSDTYLTATVPPGATTGFVTVATPGGKLKSNKEFRVTE
jgi:uncharacterized repeat protein (TIGR03803 family)